MQSALAAYEVGLIAALADGAIDWPRARAIAQELSEPVRRGDPARVVAAVEAVVLPRAMRVGVKALRTAVRAELTRLDTAAADRRRREARRRADVRMRPAGDGMSELVARMPHEDVVAVLDTLDRHARAARDAGSEVPVSVRASPPARDPRPRLGLRHGRRRGPHRHHTQRRRAGHPAPGHAPDRRRGSATVLTRHGRVDMATARRPDSSTRRQLDLPTPRPADTSTSRHLDPATGWSP